MVVFFLSHQILQVFIVISIDDDVEEVGEDSLVAVRLSEPILLLDFIEQVWMRLEFFFDFPVLGLLQLILGIVVVANHQDWVVELLERDLPPQVLGHHISLRFDHLLHSRDHFLTLLEVLNVENVNGSQKRGVVGIAQQFVSVVAGGVENEQLGVDVVSGEGELLRKQKGLISVGGGVLVFIEVFLNPEGLEDLIEDVGFPSFDLTKQGNGNQQILLRRLPDIELLFCVFQLDVLFHSNNIIL